MKGVFEARKNAGTENTNRIAELLEQELNGMSADQIAKMVQKQNHGFVISLNSKFKLWWDVAVAFLTVYVVIVTPVQVGFGLKDYQTLDNIQVFVDAMFIVELVLTFRTSYIDSATREEINDAALIRRHYMYGWFVPDAASSYPVSWFNTHDQNSSVQALK
ncbi:hypothetical protein DYB26_015547, partial [Aphanomyces astaci]